MIQLAVLDMAGTTVADDGLVERAFSTAIGAEGIESGSPEYERMIAHVRATMGESKITVFRALLGAEAAAQRANLAFETAYGELVDDGLKPIDGAEDVIRGLREAGFKVCLTTGFAATTQYRILSALGWRELADLTLCPAQAGRGRPYPDMVLKAVLELRADAVANVAVAGDTAYDMTTGIAAGAAVVAGVLTGAHGKDQLQAAGATHVLESVRDLPGLLLS
ncbi:phosphonatase-like hydrolase [Kribbella sandramycini]|uniref:Phosphonatase-like hydrolase n=1 Tax=Kribbella sandramycini TaxID=60450 RepID=A0A7Y4L2J1_9ACTN|nr:phosphonatase-like hydrolase [Kribbella sandramycini]MBB6571420.1 phosphonatase-like hydrolase [Kribbella sandramycini]NOL43180.1 phosphonatase-like hydrolase [Kribbella sandramycini]